MSARGINKVILVRRLGNDPEVRYIPNGGAVANLQVATSAGATNRREMREQTEWHRVVLFGKLAEVAGEYLRKGAQVYIEGQLRTRSWDDNGITRYITEILVKTTGTMQMLGSAPQQNAQAQPAESLSRMVSHRVLTRPKKVAQKRKAVDVRPCSRSLSRNRRRVTITGFQTISRSDWPDCDNRPALRGHHRRYEDERIFQNTSGTA